jgi:threonylcarbamoyladenosine tRNA methylthiotransferase MtaB
MTGVFFIMRTFHIINIGCKVNFADASRVKEMLLTDGYTLASAENADIVLVNTCAVTNHSELESRQIIRKIRRNNQNAFIGVMGCYAHLHSDEILATTGANATFGLTEKFKIPELLKQYIDNGSSNIPQDTQNISKPIFEISYSAEKENRTRAFLKLQDGCDARCTYCIVPTARGVSRSAEFGQIQSYIDKLAVENYKEIVITGINLSSYKASTGEEFHQIVSLLTSQYEHYPDIRFRISSIEPHIIDENLIAMIADSKNICPHFHIPLQSGCDRILQAMKRKYNTQQFANKIALISKYLPFAFIGLDVISGFPGESEGDFLCTKHFLQSLNISALHCFSYSIRKGTPAATMPNQIPKIEKKRRTNELISISEEKMKAFVKKNIGRTLNLLPEKEVNENTYTGHTENYIDVNVVSKATLNNQFYPVKIVDEHKAAILL